MVPRSVVAAGYSRRSIAFALRALAVVSFALLGVTLVIARAQAQGAQEQLALGDSLWAAGKLAEAAEAYTKALAEDRLLVRPNIRLARTLAWAQKTDSALVLLRNARERVPDDPDVRYSEALYLSWARRFDDALLRYDSLIVLAPDLDYVRVGRARTLSWAGRLDESERAYREIVARKPEDKDALRDAEFGLAQVTAWKGSLSSSARRFNDLLADDPGDPRALQGLSSVRTWQGRPRTSIILLQRALERDSTNGEIKVLLETARINASPASEIEYHYSDDSDGNVNNWITASQATFLAEQVRGAINVSLVQAGDPSRNATRTQGEATIAWILDDLRLGGGIGVRGFNVGTIGASGPQPGDRTEFTVRADASMRLPYNSSVGVGVSRAPVDDVAGLIAKSLDVSVLDLNGDITPRAGLNVALGLNLGAYSDGNHRVGATLRASQRLPARFNVGVIARNLQFDVKAGGYFSPRRFSLYELQGGWEHENEQWAGGIGAGLGTQSIDPALPWQDEYHVDGRIARRWKNGNQVALTGEISTSAASSAVGAYRYRTLGVSAKIVW
jgi:tetratricopeptide (TPR) repeat protein